MCAACSISHKAILQSYCTAWEGKFLLITADYCSVLSMRTFLKLFIVYNNSNYSIDLLWYVFFSSLQFVLNFGGIMVIVTVINFWLMIPTLLMIILFYLLRTYYVRAGRSLKRIEALSKLQLRYEPVMVLCMRRTHID